MVNSHLDDFKFKKHKKLYKNQISFKMFNSFCSFFKTLTLITWLSITKAMAVKKIKHKKQKLIKI